MDERLERLKRNREENKDVAEYAGMPLTLKDYDWLIQQAERADRNKEELEIMDKQLYSTQEHVEQLQSENERLRETMRKALNQSEWGDAGNAIRRVNEILIHTLQGK